MKKLLTCTLALVASLALAADVNVTNPTARPVPVNVVAGGAGGGAVTVADGADVTQGAKADAKSTATDTTAVSQTSILKEISFMLQGLGQGQASTTSGQVGTLMQGAVTTAAPTYVTAQTDPLSLTTGGALRVDLSSSSGVATGAGTVTNALRVAIANDSVGVGSTGTAAPTRGIFLTGLAKTANPTNATDGNTVAIMADKAGRLVTTPGNVRELVAMQTTTISASTAETTIVTAGSAGVFNDISQISITTTNTAAAVLTLKDATAGTTRAVWNYPSAAANPNVPLILNFPVPMPQAAAANNWTLTCSVNAGNFIVNVVYVKNL